MKKLLALLMALAMAFALVACGSSGSGSTASSDADASAGGSSAASSSASSGEAGGSDGDLITVGFAQVGHESDWRTASTQSCQDVFTAENGYELGLRGLRPGLRCSAGGRPWLH